MRISDWSSDVFSSDLQPVAHDRIVDPADLLRKLNELRELLAQPVGAADAGALVLQRRAADIPALSALADLPSHRGLGIVEEEFAEGMVARFARPLPAQTPRDTGRSEEHTSELQ